MLSLTPPVRLTVCRTDIIYYFSKWVSLYKHNRRMWWLINPALLFSSLYYCNQTARQEPEVRPSLVSELTNYFYWPPEDKFSTHPYFGDAETDITVQQGEAAFFNCHVFNLANQTVSWPQNSPPFNQISILSCFLFYIKPLLGFVKIM